LKNNIIEDMLEALEDNREVKGIKVYPDYNKYFDATIYFTDGTEKAVEFKLDKATAAYGNGLIEVKCNKKLSGLTTTKADYWMHIMYSKKRKNKIGIALYDRKHLKSIVLETYESRGYVKCGDNKIARGIPVSEKVLEENANAFMVCDLNRFKEATSISDYDRTKYKE